MRRVPGLLLSAVLPLALLSTTAPATGQVLFVAGGTTGTARVANTETGAVDASYQLSSPDTSFVNDVVLTKRTAWFTDSFQAQL